MRGGSNCFDHIEGGSSQDHVVRGGSVDDIEFYDATNLPQRFAKIYRQTRDADYGGCIVPETIKGGFIGACFQLSIV